MSIQARFPAPTAAKSVSLFIYFYFSFFNAALNSRCPFLMSPNEPMSFYPQPSELQPGTASLPLNGCFNDSSYDRDGRVGEFVHVQPLISRHFDMSIYQKHLSNNLFPIHVSFAASALKAEPECTRSGSCWGERRRRGDSSESDQKHVFF